MTVFSILFPRLALAVWRAGRLLDKTNRPNPYPQNMSRINTTQAAEIIASLVGALETTRISLKQAREQLRPAQDDLRAYEAADAAVDAALLEAKAKLDALAAEDAAEAAGADPQLEPEPESQPNPEPAPADEPAADPPATEDPAAAPAGDEPTA